jgi:hypothetical protein
MEAREATQADDEDDETERKAIAPAPEEQQHGGSV